MAPIGSLTADLRLNYASAVADADQAMKAISSSTGQMTLAQRQWNKALADSDPVIKAQQRNARDLAVAQARVEAAVRGGAATQKQAGAVLDSISQKQAIHIGILNGSRDAAAALGSGLAAMGSQTGQATTHVVGLSTQAMALSHSIRGAAEMLAQGVPPARVFAMELNNITYAATGPGGLKKALGEVTGLVSGLLTRTVLFAGGAAAAAAAMGYLIYSAVSTNKELESSLTGVGRNAGVTASQLGVMASNAAVSANIGLGSARKWAEGYAESGGIAGKSIQDLTSITSDYAATTHQGADEAAKQLAKDFSNLTQGVGDLNSKTGFLDAATREHILDLEAQGRHVDAVKAAYDTLKPTLVDHANELTLLGRLWAGVASGASNAVARTQDELVGTAQSNLERAKKIAAGTYVPNPLDFMGGAPMSQSAAAAEVKRLTKVIADEMAKAGKDAHKQYINNLSLTVSDIANATNPGFAEVRSLLAQQSNLLQSQKNNWAGLNPEQAAAAQHSLGQVTNALTTLGDAQGNIVIGGKHYLDQQQIAIRQDEIERQAIYAKTPAQLAEIARQRAYVQAIGQRKTATEASIIAESAAKTAYEQSAKAISDQTQALSYGVQGNLAASKAWLQGNDAEAAMVTLKYQALADAINSGVSASVREQQLLRQAVGQGIALHSQAVDALKIQTQAQADANAAVANGSLAYDRVDDYVQQHIRDLSLEALRTEALATHNIAMVKTIDKIIAAYKELDKAKPANDNMARVNAAMNPYAQDISTIGAIKGSAYSAGQQSLATSKTGLGQDYQNLQTSLAQNNPFGAAGQGGLDASLDAIKNQSEQYKQIVQAAQDAGVVSTQKAADLRVAIEQDAMMKIAQAEQQAMAQRLGFASDFFGQLATLSESKNKEIAAIGKAAAIAQATIDGILAVQKALAAYPPPFNFAMAAVVGVAAAANVAKIAGFADGIVGIQRMGGAPSDTIPAMLTPGETVITASATRDNPNILRAINAGAQFEMPVASQAANSNAPVTVIQPLHLHLEGAVVTSDLLKQVNTISQGNANKAAAATLKSAERQSRQWVADANASPRMRGSK